MDLNITVDQLHLTDIYRTFYLRTAVYMFFLRIYIQWNIIKPQKRDILPLVTAWMNLEGIRLNEKTHIEKDKYYMTSLRL